MATVTFILGYCGAGKSHLAQQMAQEQGVRVFDESFLNNPIQHRELVETLRRGADCVVIEIHYCMDGYRQVIIQELEAAVRGVVICWICFERDLATANKNCWRRRPLRDPEEHERINATLAPLYTFPPNATILPVTLAPEPND